jgi:ketosteroid isomerase-like protein
MTIAKGFQMKAQEAEAVVKNFTEAVEAGNEAALRSIYSDDVAVWHNFDNLTVSKDETIARLMQLSQLGVQFRHTLEEQLVIGDRVIRRHRVEATTPGGRRVVVPAALFATVEGGQITQIHEYLDSKAIDALRSTIAAEVGGPAAS